MTTELARQYYADRTYYQARLRTGPGRHSRAALVHVPLVSRAVM